ncbi:MAG: 3-keto-5-aminohexanoate cleavage protein [Deltaproteobacteria bacterium]|nr:MAG: 3-keto-5-aminohexanoate cleavage protein [Deltaproteobacteria bacterium]
MSQNDKVVISCALTGVLTNPQKFPVPVTPEEMAQSAKEAFDAGASVMHIHIRNQEPGLGHLPSWDPDVCEEITDAIRDACPGVLMNLTTGVVGDDLGGPLACLERTKPELAALNSGSLNYLKARSNGQWAWPPMLFDNPVEKVEGYLSVMREHNILPECECFDTGIVRSVDLFRQVGMLTPPYNVSFVMGVASGMPTHPGLLPILIDEVHEDANWQVIAIGRQEVWELHREAAKLGGNLRTGLEDTFYLPNGERAESNGVLIEALASIAEEAGRSIASPDEAREIFGIA